jgi:aminotransferase
VNGRGRSPLAVFASQRTAGSGPGQRERLLAMADGHAGLVTLGRGDPDLPTPPHIVEAAKRALDEGATHYTQWQGRSDLREAVAEKCRLDYGTAVHPGRIVITAGAQEAVYVTFQALLDPGDEVLLADPHYTSYSTAIRLAGGVPVFIPTRQARDFVVDPSEVEARISSRTKMLVVVTPENPAGAVIPRETIGQLADVVQRHNLLTIGDDIYERFVYEGPPHASFASMPELSDRTVMINGFSKSYSMTGWRLGYMVVPAPLVGAIEVVKHTLTICAPAVSQAAGLAALTGPQDCVADACATYASRRRIVLEGFERLGLGGRWSRGALYVYGAIGSTGLSAFDFCVRMLTDANVQIFPGTAYGGGEGYVRASFLQPAASLETALDRMAPVIRALHA